MIRLTPDEAVRLRVAEEARARAMTAIDQGGDLVILALDLRDAAEAYRLVSEDITRRSTREAHEARKAAGR